MDRSAVIDRLTRFFSQPGDDLVSYFVQETQRRSISLGINLLTLDEAIRQTEAVRQYTLIGESMGLFVLDDANDSNLYCFVSKGPACGMVLHLFHDGDSRIEYSSLNAFAESVDLALQNGIDIRDLPGKVRHPKVDQHSLASHMQLLADTDTDEGECELLILLPMLDTSETQLVALLASHSSFFVREAIAQRIVESPSPTLLEVSHFLANDAHPQVARPGKLAVKAVSNMNRNH